jgi:AbrB family looped-hinge helix DNA binding protein
MPKVSTKGQVTIPVALREQYRIDPETELEFEAHRDGILLRPVRGERRRLARQRVSRMLGSATNKELTTDEIMALMRGAD